METRDWAKEKEILEQAEQAEFWKPEVGQHKIEFLDEGVERTFVWEGKIIPQMNFRINLDGKEMVWSVTKASKTNSLYGQIVTVGSDKGNLTGEVITLLVQGEKLQRQYMVAEAVEINKKNKVDIEQVKE